MDSGFTIQAQQQHNKALQTLILPLTHGTVFMTNGLKIYHVNIDTL